MKFEKKIEIYYLKYLKLFKSSDFLIIGKLEEFLIKVFKIYDSSFRNYQYIRNECPKGGLRGPIDSVLWSPIFLKLFLSKDGLKRT